MSPSVASKDILPRCTVYGGLLGSGNCSRIEYPPRSKPRSCEPSIYDRDMYCQCYLPEYPPLPYPPPERSPPPYPERPPKKNVNIIFKLCTVTNGQVMRDLYQLENVSEGTGNRRNSDSHGIGASSISSAHEPRAMTQSVLEFRFNYPTVTYKCRSKILLTPSFGPWPLRELHCRYQQRALMRVETQAFVLMTAR